MSADVHARAGQLIAQERVEGISAAERSWLEAHLAECEACAAESRATGEAIRALRGVAIPLPKTLASRAQMRVRLRAEQLQEYMPRWRMMWTACGISWAFGAVTAPYVWRGLEWIGHRLGVPNIIWELGFGLWWAIPAVFAAVIVLMENTRRTNESDWFEQQR
jgi:predicted anti-sigma-YlaC factor YlaD